MADSRPVREQDRFIIRLPDGMRERIATRATANRRSMNQEIISMLLQVMENPDELQLNELEAELHNIDAAIHAKAGELEGLDRRKFAIMDEIEARRAKLAR